MSISVDLDANCDECHDSLGEDDKVYCEACYEGMSDAGMLVQLERMGIVKKCAKGPCQKYEIFEEMKEIIGEGWLCRKCTAKHEAEFMAKYTKAA